MSSNKDQSSFSYPVPVVNYSKDPEDVTIGVFKGELSGGRPFVADIWWWDNFIGVTYRFSKIDLDNATEDDIVKLLEESKQIMPVNTETRKLVNGLIELKDTAGNEIWNISIHLGMSDRISILEPDGVIRSYISSEIKDIDGGPPPMVKILDPSVDTLIMALIVIQMVDNMPMEEQEGIYNSLSKEFRDYIQELKRDKINKNEIIY